jgi:uncharacterized membrane protein YagU involved in acid resistance
MLVTAIVLAIIAALIDHMWGIGEPWRKLIYGGCVVLFVVGLVMLLLGYTGPLPWR